MSKPVEMLNGIVGDLFDFLGGISKGMTEEDFRAMEAKGMKVDRELIKEARRVHASKQLLDKAA